MGFGYIRSICLEPISKSPEEHDEGGELDKPEKVLGVVLPADQDTALPLYPCEEAFDEPPSHVTSELSRILRGRLASVGAVRSDHLDAVLTQFFNQRIAVVGTVTNQSSWLRFDHVGKSKHSCTKRTS